MEFGFKRSPDGAPTSNGGSRHWIAAYYSFIDPEWMKGWVGLSSRFMRTTESEVGKTSYGSV